MGPELRARDAIVVDGRLGAQKVDVTTILAHGLEVRSVEAQMGRKLVFDVEPALTRGFDPCALGFGALGELGLNREVRLDGHHRPGVRPARGGAGRDLRLLAFGGRYELGFVFEGLLFRLRLDRDHLGFRRSLLGLLPVLAVLALLALLLRLLGL